MSSNDKGRFDLAEDTLKSLYGALQPDSTMWWYSAYYLVKCRYERGSYRDANDLLGGIKRAVNKLGGDTSLAPAFADLENELKKKIK
jgi:hypothetical protein